MNNQIFYVLSFQTCTNMKNMSITVEVLNKSSCFIYGEKCYNKMTTNEKHSINKDKLKCVRMEHKESTFERNFLFIHVVGGTKRQRCFHTHSLLEMF